MEKLLKTKDIFLLKTKLMQTTR